MGKGLKFFVAWLLAIVMISGLTGCNNEKEKEASQEGTPEIGQSEGSGDLGNNDSTDSGSSDTDAPDTSVKAENPDAPVSSEAGNSDSQVPSSGENFEEDGFEGSSGEEDLPADGEGNTSSEEVPPVKEPVNQKNEIEYDAVLAKEYEDYLAMTLEQKAQFQKERFNEDPKAFRAWRTEALQAYNDKKASESYSGSLDLGELLKKDTE